MKVVTNYHEPFQQPLSSALLKPTRREFPRKIAHWSLNLVFPTFFALLACGLQLGETPPEVQLPGNVENVERIESPLGAGSVSGFSFEVEAVSGNLGVIEFFDGWANANDWRKIRSKEEPWVTWKWVMEQDSEEPRQDLVYRAHWVSGDNKWSLRVVLVEPGFESLGGNVLQKAHVSVSRFVLLDRIGEPL